MANVELKTDFKDGEKLYGPELNNNFKAIKAALEAMNRIVWQDDQEIPDTVLAFRGTTEELMNREIIDGQLLYDTNTGETYIDYEGRRISTGSGNAIHIGENEPTNPSTQLWIPTDEFTSVGTEVVNSLEGNETAKAPSVDAVKKGLASVVESGKDGRKFWEKYDNGTLVQWGYISWSWLEFTATGNLYQTGELTVELPVAFVGDLSNTCTNLISAAAGDVYWNKSSFLKDASTIGGYFLKTVSGNTDIYARYFAIGKWK